MSSIMSSVLRKSIRLSLVSSLASIQHRSLSISSSYSSSSSSVVSSSLLLGKSLRGSSPFLSFRFSSSVSSAAKKVVADETLKRVLDSEIKCTEEESNQLDQGLPDLSPFEIVDNPGEQTITLKREFAGESIQVEVHMSDIEGEGEEDDEDDAQSGDDNDEMNKHQPNVSLIVAVAKGKGPHLEFCCTAYPDEITIDRMLIKGNEVSADQIAYEGLEFSDLDEELQKAFYKYLEVRGIKSSLTNSLQQYMVSKDNREYLSHNFRMVPDSMIETSEMRSRELLVYYHHQCINCNQARQSNIKACRLGPLVIKQMKMSAWNEVLGETVTPYHMLKMMLATNI